MNFKEKTLLTLTKKAGGILGPEMYVLPEGIAAYTKVTEDPTYYLVRSDRENWDSCAKEIKEFIPPHIPVMEYGPGGSEALRKVKGIIKALNSHTYTGVDISRTSIERALNAIESIKADIETIGLLCDFWDQSFPVSGEATLALFAGGSIENIDVPAIDAPPQEELTAALEILGKRTNGGWVLVSVDALQERFPPEFYLQAYSGPAHAAFNLGVLHRMKTELELDFDPSCFLYKPAFHEKSGAILHIARATKSQAFRLGDTNIEIREGDEFHLQNSFRFTEPFFTACAERAGLRTLKIWKHPTTSMQLYLMKSCKKEENTHQSSLEAA